MEEPGSHKKEAYYDIITCNVRITRDLNNINLEQEEKTDIDSQPNNEQRSMAEECLSLFHEIITLMKKLQPDMNVNLIDTSGPTPFQFSLNAIQMISLEKLRIELKSMKADLEHLQKVDIA